MLSTKVRCAFETSGSPIIVLLSVERPGFPRPNSQRPAKPHKTADLAESETTLGLGYTILSSDRGLPEPRP